MRLIKMLAVAAVGTCLAAPLGAQAATGLSGAYYELPPADGIIGVGPQGPGSIAQSLTDIASLSPTATFLATSACFPSCGGTIDDGNNLAAFLGGNATNVSSNSISNLGNHVVVLTGFISAATAGVQNFTLESDDGSELLINGNLVNDDGDHGFGGPTTGVNLNAGLNAIKIIQFEDGGATGLTVLENGNSLVGLSPAPEPATWAMMLFGLSLIGAGLRMARRTDPLAAI